MHQPVYIPYYSAYEIIIANGIPGGHSFSFSLSSMWEQKQGPYKTWPLDAIEHGMNSGLPHIGAQISLTGSLIESLNNLEQTGWNNGIYIEWKNRWLEGINWLTSMGNKRIDLVNIPFHHPILGLLWEKDIDLQLKCYQKIFQDNFGITSKGLFPPETGFSVRIIPSLIKNGIKWVIVDNIHISRTLLDYPYNGGTGIVEPNKADQRNGYLSEHPNSGWLQFYNVWAPEMVAAGFSHKPHYTKYVNPKTGEIYKIIVIPAECYLGNEDGRGGFGALDYEGTFSQLEPYDTDPLHPIFFILHHDGENHGGGSESYYHSNFQNMVNWALSESTRFVPTTIEEYLEMFPPDTSDIIHVEDGGWIGAGTLDPEFHKWLGDPSNGYSPDWNSWAVITACHNWVWTANSNIPYSSIQDIIYDSGNETSKAFHDYLCALSSDYEYWEGSPDEIIWNSNSTRACNLAIEHIKNIVINGTDTIGPTIFLPQREPYNPGGTEFGNTMPSDFEVWSFIYDVKGIKKVFLKYRVDNDGYVDYENEIYNWGIWDSISMTPETWESQTDPLPYYKAKRYKAYITGISQAICDYYITAEDSLGNKSSSPIMHVYVGNTSSASNVWWEPENPDREDTIKIYINSQIDGWLHWGVNGWNLPDSAYWPPESYIWEDSNALESPLSGSAPNFFIKLGPFNQEQYVSTINFVIHFEDGSWNNNNGNDYHIIFQTDSSPYIIDGILDPIAEPISENQGYTLWAHFNSGNLYIATNSAVSGKDHFIFISTHPESLYSHPWAKNGKVAFFSFYLGEEGENGWCHFYDSLNNFTNFPCASGECLEGVIPLYELFGDTINSIYLCAAGYETQNQGELLWQVPPEMGAYPEDIEDIEYHLYHLNSYKIYETNKKNNKPKIKTFFKSLIHINLKSSHNIKIFNITGRKTPILKRNKILTPPSGIYFILIQKNKEKKLIKGILIK